MTEADPFSAPPAETKEQRKQRLKDEKAAAKLAKREQKLAAQQAKADEKAARKDAKAAAKQPLRDDATLSEKWERYNHLHANVRRRRTAYVLIIVLAIAVFVATAWDIVYNESDYKWYLLPAYVVLALWGIILLFSRKRHLQEVAELEAMQRTYLECPSCTNVFQFGELRFSHRKQVGFTCPVCSEESNLPGLDARPIERPLPEAGVIETAYACGNCAEQIVVGTFGTTPRESRFRACPSCGVEGQVSLA